MNDNDAVIIVLSAAVLMAIALNGIGDNVMARVQTRTSARSYNSSISRGRE